MSTYVDSSVILRFVLEQPGRLEPLPDDEELVTSALTWVECLRAVDNVRHVGGFEEDEYLVRRSAVHSRMRGVTTVEVSNAVLLRAGSPLPAPLKTLDAIHLATALLWCEDGGEMKAIATHDRRLATVASALGFTVIGV